MRKYHAALYGRMAIAEQRFADADDAVERTLYQRRYSSARPKHIRFIRWQTRSSGDPRLHLTSNIMGTYAAVSASWHGNKIKFFRRTLKKASWRYFGSKQEILLEEVPSGQPRDWRPVIFPLLQR